MTGPSQPSLPTAASYPFLPTALRYPEDEEEKEFFVLENINKIVDTANAKTIGIHLPAEVYNGEVWNYGTPQETVRYGFRTIIFIPAVAPSPFSPLGLPNVGTKSYAHGIKGINSEFAITDLYVAASNRTTLQYRLITDDHVTMDANNVTITTTFDGTGYQAYVVIEYVRNA